MQCCLVYVFLGDPISTSKGFLRQMGLFTGRQQTCRKLFPRLSHGRTHTHEVFTYIFTLRYTHIHMGPATLINSPGTASRDRHRPTVSLYSYHNYTFTFLFTFEFFFFGYRYIISSICFVSPLNSHSLPLFSPSLRTNEYQLIFVSS